jgi:hypothetical protein
MDCEDMDLDRFLRTVGLRHRSAADELAFADIGHRRLHHGDDQNLLCKVELEFVAFGRFRRHGVAVNLLDDAAQADGLRLLSKGQRCYK